MAARDARLEAVDLAGAGLGDGEQQPRDVDVAQVGAVADDVGAQPADVGAEVEGLARRAGLQPRGRLQPDRTRPRARRDAHGPQRQRPVGLVPAQDQGEGRVNSPDGTGHA
jgi:hypothetical protein